MILRLHSPSFTTPRLRLRLRCIDNTTPQPRIAPRLLAQRPFTTSPCSFQDSKPTHYEILGVPASISPTDLKKRFYVLSKENHPDLHPHSKEHTTKFQQISESYSVLADADRRKKYDRDVMGSRPQVQKGSGFAGSRPATGLSKRRSVFRGPPPSYSRTSNTAGSKNEGTGTGNEAKGGSAYAWGPEPQFSQTADFNSQPVFKTQSAEDERRNRRRSAAAAAAQTAFDEEGEFWARFVMVTVVVVVGVSVGSLVVGMMDSQPKGGGMVRGDGTMRRSESGTKKKDPG